MVWEGPAPTPVSSNSDGTVLTLAGDPFDAARDGDRLELVYTDSSFDFGSGSVPATLRIVMGRM